jgi:hypothetical protein
MTTMMRVVVVILLLLMMIMIMIMIIVIMGLLWVRTSARRPERLQAVVYFGTCNTCVMILGIKPGEPAGRTLDILFFGRYNVRGRLPDEV